MRLGAAKAAVHAGAHLSGGAVLWGLRVQVPAFCIRAEEGGTRRTPSLCVVGTFTSHLTDSLVIDNSSKSLSLSLPVLSRETGSGKMPSCCLWLFPCRFSCCHTQISSRHWVTSPCLPHLLPGSVGLMCPSPDFSQLLLPFPPPPPPGSLVWLASPRRGDLVPSTSS